MTPPRSTRNAVTSLLDDSNRQRILVILASLHLGEGDDGENDAQCPCCDDQNCSDEDDRQNVANDLNNDHGDLEVECLLAHFVGFRPAVFEHKPDNERWQEAQDAENLRETRISAVLGFRELRCVGS